MTDNITALIAEARRWATKPDDYVEDDLLIRLADALEATVAERDERELAMRAVPGYTKPAHFYKEFKKVIEDLLAAEAERDRYRAALGELHAGLTRFEPVAFYAEASEILSRALDENGDE